MTRGNNKAQVATKENVVRYNNRHYNLFLGLKTKLFKTQKNLKYVRYDI